MKFFKSISRLIFDRYIRNVSRKNGKTLLFSYKNPFVYSAPILRRLGGIYFVKEKKLTPTTILSYINKNKIDRVLFNNPYANNHRLRLYNSIKAKGIPFIVAERGALRDSIFFDWSGFNAESPSYCEKHWNFPISHEERKIVDDYISTEKSISASLEEQPEYKETLLLKKELGITDKKVLFVPLQRRNDTVIQYFCGDIETYENFIALVSKVGQQLSNEWVVVVKNHPLENNRPHIKNVIFSNENIKSLINVCDYVLLINSGVGVLSMLWNKPVLYAGEVFYNHDEINRKVTTYRDILSVISEGFQPKTECIDRFLFFLIARFYSFGSFETKEIECNDGSLQTITTSIRFDTINNLDVNSHYS